MKTIELNYCVRVNDGTTYSRNSLRAWPQGFTLGDVMADLVKELQALGCSDITVTQAARETARTATFYPAKNKVVLWLSPNMSGERHCTSMANARNLVALTEVSQTLTEATTD